MKNPIEELKNISVRTPFEKAVKASIISLTEEKEAVQIELPVESNNKDVLEQFAKEHKINISEPGNKPQYVDAVNAWLEENS